jgi:hypothetical protein
MIISRKSLSSASTSPSRTGLWLSAQVRALNRRLRTLIRCRRDCQITRLLSSISPPTHGSQKDSSLEPSASPLITCTLRLTRKATHKRSHQSNNIIELSTKISGLFGWYLDRSLNFKAFVHIGIVILVVFTVLILYDFFKKI